MPGTGEHFRYKISGVKGVVDVKNPLWKTSLSGGTNKPQAPEDETSSSFRSVFTVGEYFEAATVFLQSDGYAALKKALDFNLENSCDAASIDTVDICLEKHGAFYHPSRVEVKLNSSEVFIFVLNVAVSSAGLSLIEHEYGCLCSLAAFSKADKYIPHVYEKGFIVYKGHDVGFLLAHWFRGFKEFHVTGNPEHAEVSLWASDGALIPVSHPDYFNLFEQASGILTHFYNVTTFEQIFPWHHAAGDFVARQNKRGYEVRLITVRGYASMVETDSIRESPELDDIHAGLLIFLANLSLRMRIDRLNGTGQYYFMDAEVLPFVLRGFFRELSLKRIDHLPEIKLHDTFSGFLETLDREDISECFLMITAAAPRNRPETILIEKYINAHIESFWQELREMGKISFFIDNA